MLALTTWRLSYMSHPVISEQHVADELTGRVHPDVTNAEVTQLISEIGIADFENIEDASYEGSERPFGASEPIIARIDRCDHLHGGACQTLELPHKLNQCRVPARVIASVVGIDCGRCKRAELGPSDSATSPLSRSVESVSAASLS